jgi:hypothetical protein
MAHPRADFAQHYTIPYWVEAGFAACALNTRYLNNDTMMLHENLLLDLAAAIRFLREEEGFERVVMLGNSAALAVRVLRRAQARAAHGQRVGAPRAGRRTARPQPLRTTPGRRSDPACRASGPGDGFDGVDRCGGD